MKRFWKIFFVILFLFSLLGNMIFLCSDILFDYRMWNLNKTNNDYQPISSNIEEFRQRLIDGCITQLDNGSEITPPHRGRVIDNLHSNFNGYGKHSAVGFLGGGVLHVGHSKPSD